MIEIPLTQGKIALVDDRDAELVGRYKWCAQQQTRGIFRAVTRFRKANGKTTLLPMSRLIMGVENDPTRWVDHQDGNPLNNLRSNLRYCNQAENRRNSRRKHRRSSPYKGVDRMNSGRWRAAITVNYKKTILGYFNNPEDAAMAYNAAAKKAFGEFARLNIVERYYLVLDNPSGVLPSEP